MEDNKIDIKNIINVALCIGGVATTKLLTQKAIERLTGEKDNTDAMEGISLFFEELANEFRHLILEVNSGSNTDKQRTSLAPDET